jgi:HlyD family secretion protein
MSWLKRVWTGISIGLVALLSFLVATHELGAWPWIDRRPLRDRYLFRHVSFTDLHPTLNAAGRLDSTKNTLVRCELENIAGGRGGASSTILTVLPEGSVVKRGDVLASLDASTYEELLRQQVMTVEQAKASHLQAQLNHEISLLAVREFRDGTVQETLKGMEGSIALARSDLSRAADHLTWTRRMKEKGYASSAQIVSEVHMVSQLELSVQRQLTSLELFQRFTQPKTEKNLQGQVKATETSLGNEDLRLQRQLERLALLKKQVERCQIRAPHGGVLYYYKDPRRGQSTPIDEGMAVRQRQPLFYLPDLSEMEVQVALNESIVDQVHRGLRATVTFEALPELTVEGEVVSVSPIPVIQMVRSEQGQNTDTGVRFFTCNVRLARVADRMKPGMTSKVDIELTRRQHVLAIPHEAVRWDHGKKVCYVASEESLERREVKIGQDTCDLVEVLDGVREGEMVALNPPVASSHVEPLLNFGEIDQTQPASIDSVAASQQ